MGAAVVILVWCLIAIVLAVLAFLRMGWARILLALSAGASALLSLVLILSVISVFTLIPAVATVILLFTRSSNAWFARRPPEPSYPGPPPAGPPPPDDQGQPPYDPGSQRGPW
jgi:hypothetical protein